MPILSSRFITIVLFGSALALSAMPACKKKDAAVSEPEPSASETAPPPKLPEPAPPVVALIGLLGILLGEQLVPIAKRLLADKPVTSEWTRAHCAPHVFGELPRSGTTDKEVA